MSPDKMKKCTECGAEWTEDYDCVCPNIYCPLNDDEEDE